MTSDESIARFKIFGLKWHLLFDVWSDEDVFEIHPLSLGFNPFLNNFHDKLDIQRELFCITPDGFNVSVGKGVVYVGEGLI